MGEAERARLRDAVAPTRHRVHGDAGAQVAACLRQLIFDGHLRDGDRLPQEDLADVLGVSRIPVRDGLIQLAAEGWVAMAPGRGAQVVGLDEAAVRDEVELLGHVWGALCRRAVERATPSGLARLDAARAAVEGAIDAAVMGDANTRFIRALEGLAAAPRLNAWFRLGARLVPGNFFAVVPGSVEVQRRHVAEIGRAVERGDADRAVRSAAELHAAHADAIVACLAERGVLARRPAPTDVGAPGAARA